MAQFFAVKAMVSKPEAAGKLASLINETMKVTVLGVLEEPSKGVLALVSYDTKAEAKQAWESKVFASMSADIGSFTIRTWMNAFDGNVSESCYVAYCLDKENSIELRKSTRPAHVEWLKSSTLSNGKIGPFTIVNEKENNAVQGAVGSLLIVDYAAGMDELAKFLKNDPYAKAGLFASTELYKIRIIKQ
mmetsp:Transcript_5511/g.9801  ORF Transcript_5511/g.9801 Transcript_5511/m.9801 type:complete len:189 (+) Transcript_5511:98-664(+)